MGEGMICRIRSEVCMNGKTCPFQISYSSKSCLGYLRRWIIVLVKSEGINTYWTAVSTSVVCDISGMLC